MGYSNVNDIIKKLAKALTTPKPEAKTKESSQDPPKEKKADENK